MDNYGKHEDGLDILAALGYLVTKWKSIIIIAIIGLVLGAGYAVISTNEAAVPADNTGMSAEETTSYDMAKRTYEESQKRVEMLEEYLAESAYMAINPYDVQRSTISYSVEGLQKELPGVNAAIYSYVIDGALIEDLVKVGPYTEKEVDLLISIEQSPEEFVVLNENSLGQTTFRISIMTGTEKEAKELLDQMKISLDAYIDTLKEQQVITSYEHLSSEVKTVVANVIAEDQSYFREKYNNEKSNLNTYKEKYESEASSANVLTENGGISKGTLIKYGGVGFVGGAVIAIVFWILVCVFDSRLYAITDKEKRFGTKLLASIYNYEKLRGIDLLLGHKLGGVYSKMSLAEQQQVALLNIKTELEKRDTVDKVFLASSWTKSQVEMQFFKTALEEAGYVVVIGNNIIGNAEILKEAALCDVAIIIESNNVSKTALVREEINILNQYVGDVLGLIVVQNKL